jgi:hypothetical protein
VVQRGQRESEQPLLIEQPHKLQVGGVVTAEHWIPVRLDAFADAALPEIDLRCKERLLELIKHHPVGIRQQSRQGDFPSGSRQRDYRPVMISRDLTRLAAVSGLRTQQLCEGCLGREIRWGTSRQIIAFSQIIQNLLLGGASVTVMCCTGTPSPIQSLYHSVHRAVSGPLAKNALLHRARQLTAQSLNLKPSRKQGEREKISLARTPRVWTRGAGKTGLALSRTGVHDAWGRFQKGKSGTAGTVRVPHFFFAGAGGSDGGRTLSSCAFRRCLRISLSFFIRSATHADNSGHTHAPFVVVVFPRK